MTRPIVGVTFRAWKRPGRALRIMQNEAYLAAVERAGGIPLPIPPSTSPGTVDALVDLCDAVCLPGGKDVDPASYGEATDPACHVESMAELDAVEVPLVRRLLDRGTPMLGICRGLQVVNVALGGTLWQDLGPAGRGVSTQRPAVAHLAAGDDPAVSTTQHPVTVEDGTVLRDLVGSGRIEVNSRHHQAIRTLGAGLRVAARADDGLIEAVEVDGHPFALAVQWHPEELTVPHANSLFSGLVSAAAAARRTGTEVSRT